MQPGHPVLRRLIRRVLGLSTPSAPVLDDVDFKTAVFTTAPDPTEWMSDDERRYHLNNQHGR